MRIHWIWLSTRPGLSDRGRAALLRHFPDAEDIFFADGDAFACMNDISEEARASLRDKNLTQAEEILGECARKKIHILTYRDAAYPVRLKNIPDPPVVLYYKGRLLDFDALPLVGVVGTRSASAYGLGVGKRMGYQIAACGGIVVSGMAFGIDGMAMRGALTADAPVVGVLGCGADVVYPASNRSLFADVERHGCLLTEFPPGTPPTRWNFPRRNRLISGLSCGVLVVEAPVKSGALITARQAADQGRDVFVVPGNIDVESCRGSNALLRDGAIAVSSGWDVVGEYEAMFPDKIRNCVGPARQTAYPDEVEAVGQEAEQPTVKVAQRPRLLEIRKREKPKEKKKEIDNGDSPSYIDAEENSPALTEQEQKIVALVARGGTLVDDILAGAELPAGTALAALTTLEVKGVVARLPGRRVALKKGK